MLVCIVPSAQFFLQVICNITQPCCKESDNLIHSPYHNNDRKGHRPRRGNDCSQNVMRPLSANYSKTGEPDNNDNDTNDTVNLTTAIKETGKRYRYCTWILHEDRIELMCQSLAQDIISSGVFRKTFFVDWTLNTEKYNKSIATNSESGQINTKCQEGFAFDLEIESLIHGISALATRSNMSGLRMKLTVDDVPSIQFESSQDLIESVYIMRLAEPSVENVGLKRLEHVPPTGQTERADAANEEAIRINIRILRECLSDLTPDSTDSITLIRVHPISAEKPFILQMGLRNMRSTSNWLFKFNEKVFEDVHITESKEYLFKTSAFAKISRLMKRVDKAKIVFKDNFVSLRFLYRYDNGIHDSRIIIHHDIGVLLDKPSEDKDSN